MDFGTSFASNIAIYPKLCSPFEDTVDDHEIPLETTKKCKCGGKLGHKNDGTSYICTSCGMMLDIIGDEMDSEKSSSSYRNNYNTFETSSPLRVYGQNSGQKGFICKTTDYKKTQLRDTIKQLQNIMSQSELSISQNVIVETANMYQQIQQYIIKRGDVRRGILAACLNKICKSYDIILKSKEISQMFKIKQSDLSNGEKILGEYKMENGNEKNTDLFLSRYFELLQIMDPTGQKMEFAKRLIRFTELCKIAQNSVPSSKCAGSIYLISSTDAGSAEDIEKKCKISKYTFKRFANNVLDALKNEQKPNIGNKLRHLFKKYNIHLK
jgi:transcription initiation factor TFIIIB Brf1 subunit/transcription initiation factor TFIIB